MLLNIVKYCNEFLKKLLTYFIWASYDLSLSNKPFLIYDPSILNNAVKLIASRLQICSYFFLIFQFFFRRNGHRSTHWPVKKIEGFVLIAHNPSLIDNLDPRGPPILLQPRPNSIKLFWDPIYAFSPKSNICWPTTITCHLIPTAVNVKNFLKPKCKPFHLNITFANKAVA